MIASTWFPVRVQLNKCSKLWRAVYRLFYRSAYRLRSGVGVVVAAAAFVAGMAVALGQTAANIGMVSLVMLTIFAGQR